MLNRTKTHLALLISLIATALLSTALLAGAAQAAPKVWNLPGATISSSDGPASTPAFATGTDGTVYAVWTRRYGSTNYRIEFSQRAPGGEFTPGKAISADSGAAFAPQIVQATDGRLIAVWYRGGKIEASERMPGGEFGTPLVISPNDRTASNPRISAPADSQSTIVIVWDQTGGSFGPRIGASVWRADLGFSDPFPISNENQPATGARVLYDPTEDQHVAMWSAEVAGHTRVQTSIRIGGGAFQTPVNHSSGNVNSRDAEFAVGSDGRIMLAWNSNLPTGWAIQARHWGSSTPVVTLSEDGNPSFDPEVAAGPAGGFIVTWAESMTDGKRIRIAERPAAGPFSPAQTISPADVTASQPLAAIAGNGTAYLTWLQATAVGQQQIGTFREPGAAFADPTELTGATYPANDPALLALPDNEAVAGWVRRGRVEVITTGPELPPNDRPKDPNDPNRPGPGAPPAGVAIFDGKNLHFRLKCPGRFKPSCRGNAQAVAAKGKAAKAMTGKVKAGQKAGAWKTVKLTVKAKFRARIAQYAKRPGKRTLLVRQVVSAAKHRSGKKQLVFHKYRVRGES